jgi:hypothetical protein
MDTSTNLGTCGLSVADGNSKARGFAVLLLVALAVVSSALGQTEHPVKGIVLTKDARPLAGVVVNGSVWKRCCPYQQEKATTDGKGEFHLKHPGAVIHFSKAKMKPLAFVVTPGTSQVRIVMTLAENDLTVPTCAQPEPGQKLIGWGKYGLQFAVPKDGMQVLGGEPDVDYVRYVVKPHKGESYLELWFGPYSMATEPDDEQFVESANFSQRNLVSVKGEVIGMDSWGQLNSGLSWRHTGAFGSGAIYRNVSQEAAPLFDQIINSICKVPAPTK